MEYYLALKINEQSSHEKTWKKREFILLSKRSQFEEPVYSIIPVIMTLCNTQNYGGKKEICGCQELGGKRDD